MAAVAPIIRILPAILRLFAPVRTAKIVRGTVIPLQDITPSTDTELDRALNRKLNLKKKKDFNDLSHVVTIEDVRKIYEEEGTKKNVVVDVALAIGAALVTEEPAPGTSSLEKFGNQFMDKIREKALKQTAARKNVTYRYPKREI